MGFPDGTLCMACHEAVAAEKPAIKKLARFTQSKRPIPWVRVYSVPAFVFWNHRTHLEASQQCADCHGNVSEMDVLRTTNVTTMDGCVQCHEKKMPALVASPVTKAAVPGWTNSSSCPTVFPLLHSDALEQESLSCHFHTHSSYVPSGLGQLNLPDLPCPTVPAGRNRI